MQFSSKKAKIRKVKIFKKFHYAYKPYSKQLSNPKGGSFALEIRET